MRLPRAGAPPGAHSRRGGQRQRGRRMRVGHIAAEQPAGGRRQGLAVGWDEMRSTVKVQGASAKYVQVAYLQDGVWCDAVKYLVWLAASLEGPGLRQSTCRVLGCFCLHRGILGCSCHAALLGGWQASSAQAGCGGGADSGLLGSARPAQGRRGAGGCSGGAAWRVSCCRRPDGMSEW